ncbi:MAG TPA: serine O-acetyltransferase [Candidatus Acidoferrum sp.]|nr:serine O-acetyltransferase [Candidatus Acidoferrum sp.]
MDSQRMNTLSLTFGKALGTKLAGGDKTFELPSRRVVTEICQRYVQALFPLFYHSDQGSNFPRQARRYLKDTEALLAGQICHAIRLQCHCQGGRVPAGIEKSARERVDTVLEKLPGLARLLASDVDAAFGNDPAATGPEEVLLSYPSIEAITVQRLAHSLYLLEIPFIPRMMTEVAHNHTGIDIHPGAAIGESFFIDHGTGVVIGETATIGSRVTLYQGVTLGAFNPLAKDDHARLRRGRTNKRHPELDDHVTVYPYATILGGHTRVGHHSVIGGNVWLTHSVEPYSKVVVKDPELLIHDGSPESLREFKSAGAGI